MILPMNSGTDLRRWYHDGCNWCLAVCPASEEPSGGGCASCAAGYFKDTEGDVACTACTGERSASADDRRTCGELGQASCHLMCCMMGFATGHQLLQWHFG
jgi:hypothetical protein